MKIADKRKRRNIVYLSTFIRHSSDNVQWLEEMYIQVRIESKMRGRMVCLIGSYWTKGRITGLTVLSFKNQRSNVMNMTKNDTE